MHPTGAYAAPFSSVIRTPPTVVMTTTQGQFPDLPLTSPPRQDGLPPVGKPRLLRAERHQARWQVVDLDNVLAADHPARAVWAFVEGLDLSAFTLEVRAVEGHAGRPAIDPAILLGLWLYAQAGSSGAGCTGRTRRDGAPAL